MRIAITGATGVLGSALAKAVVKRGDELVVFSRKPNDLGPRLDGLPLSSFAADATGMKSCIEQGQIDVLIHTACSYGRQGETAADLLAANVLAPLRLLEAAGKSISRLIAIGTGLPPTVSPYALAKFQFASWLEKAPAPAERIVVALEHFYGPNDDSSKFITWVTRQCLNGERLALTSGEQERDFIHIDDVVSLLRFF